MKFIKMMKWLIGISFAMSLVFTDQSAIAQKEFKYSDFPLTWRDFVKKNVAVSSNTAAVTTIELKLTSSVENNKLLIVIELIQDRDQSWISKQFLKRATDQESIDLLNHEKLHYAINLIGLKTLFNELSAYEFTNDYQSELSGIFNRINRNTTKTNADYDRQTYHGINKEEQEKWKLSIFKQIGEIYKKEEAVITTYSILKNINK